MKEEYYENPCCILDNNICDTKRGFAYFSRSGDIVSDLDTNIIDFNDVPVMTEIFDYNEGSIKIKSAGWYYIQYIINIPYNDEISTSFAIYGNNEALEGTIIEVSNKKSNTTNCYGAQTIVKLEKNTEINIKSLENIDLKFAKPYKNSLSIFILKLI